MLRSRVLPVLLLPILLALMAFRQAPLVNPAPIAVTSKMSSAQVLKAVKMALVHRGWTITSLKPGIVESSLNTRDHVARIEVDYNRHQVAIKYVGSSNLKYEMKNGTAYIHKNYLGWVENLSKDIQNNLLLLGD